MPNYKLIYFDMRGKGEPVRIMFALADVKYEDKRIKHDDWKDLKSKTGFGLLPILVVDGKELPQSGAIYRYIGSLHGFYPTEPWERARVDVVTGSLLDIDPHLKDIFLESDAAKKAELVQKFATEGIVKHLDILETLLKQNNGGSGWFVGKKITIADIRAFCVLHDVTPAFTGKTPGKLDLSNHILLKGFVDRFKVEPKVAAWLAKRPANDF